MSYSFNLGFIAVANKLEAFESVQKFVNTLIQTDIARQWLKHNEYYIAHCVNASNFDALNRAETFVLRYALQDLFTVNAFYWQKHNILGILGCGWPKQLMEQFHATQYFQNSCDRNYEYESWSDKIPLFKVEKEINEAATDEEILKMARSLFPNRYYEPDDPDEELDIDYIRKQFLYDRIFSMLDLEKLLYGGNGSFERVSLCGLTTIEAVYDMEDLAKVVLKRI